MGIISGNDWSYLEKKLIKQTTKKECELIYASGREKEPNKEIIMLKPGGLNM